jgi:Ala-tRNA(Pro) deacylase
MRAALEAFDLNLCERPSMPATPDDLFAYLETLGIKSETMHHQAVFTVEESKRLRGEIPGAHVKNLFLKDKKSNLFLISALEDTRIDLKTIHDVIGGQGRVSFCSADQLREHLGVEPGSVTPLAVFNDKESRVTAILDERMMAYDVINVHPLVNTMTTSLKRDDLLAFMTSTSHKPLVIKVGEAAPEDA